MNQTNIIGNLGKDAELRYMANGAPLVEFSVAVNEPKPKDSDKEQHTEWFNCSWWGRAGGDGASVNEKVAPFLVKGKQVFITGKMRTRKWDDDQGETRYRTNLIVDNVELLGSREGGDRTGRMPEDETPDWTDAREGDIDVDDLPFE